MFGAEKEAKGEKEKLVGARYLHSAFLITYLDYPCFQAFSEVFTTRLPYRQRNERTASTNFRLFRLSGIDDPSPSATWHVRLGYAAAVRLILTARERHCDFIACTYAASRGVPRFYL